MLPDRKLKTLQQMEPVRLGLVRSEEFSNGVFGIPGNYSRPGMAELTKVPERFEKVNLH